MTNYMISGLSALTAPASGDLLVVVDVDDNSTAPAGAGGSDKKTTVAQLTAAMGVSRSYDVMIAASNAPAAFKAAADVVLTGTADQTAINTALAALASSGGRALLSPGNVSITGPIVLNQSYCELHGCGYGTYIQAASSFSGTGMIKVGTAAVLNGLRIQDLQLDGNFGVASGTTHGILLSAGETIISRCEIKNTTGKGIYIQAYDGTTPLYEVAVEDTHIWSPAGYGLHVGTTCDNSEFQRVYAVGSNQGTPVAGSSDGIYVEGSDCKFFQCHPYFNAGNGMTIADGTENITVVDGEYETNTGYGILVAGSDHVTITGGASFYANGYPSIGFVTSDDNLQGQVTGCKFHDLGTGTNTTAAITADANTFGLSITGNTFDCASVTHLVAVITLAGQGVNVTSNIFRINNSAQYSVYLNGATECTVIGNFLDEQVVEAGAADYNTIAHNRWNNTAAKPVTLTGAHSVATDNLPALQAGAEGSPAAQLAQRMLCV